MLSGTDESDVTNTHDTLQQAIQATQSGDKETAKRLLAFALRANPSNVQAWLRMSEAVDTDAQRRECLQRVLDIEPDNQVARAELARLATAPPPIAIERDRDRLLVGIAATPAHAPTQTQQHRVKRYIKLAGGLTLSLVLGLALLVFALTRVIPQAREGAVLSPERAVHTATLWCPSCERQGQPVILSTRIGASFYTSARASGLPHGARVSVLRYRWSTLEKQYYALVAAEGKRGWVPETQIRR